MRQRPSLKKFIFLTVIFHIAGGQFCFFSLLLLLCF
ncbi:unnamed protein product [Haemonchus placei]|uniref:7TM_GPCR_Srx domain-containing protein n=1 Tax=Haemonchus placei TaxID=6290 RepID=A0A0N4VZQ9_HAEPC|nr:unnamed protein product [Haemonchus placei]